MPILAPLAAVGGFLRKGWPLLLAGALALFLGLHMRSDAATKRKLEAATETVRKFKAANEAATKWALAEKRVKELAAKDIKETANADLAEARRAGAGAADRYARDHRCVRVEAGSGGRQRPDLPRPDSAAGQPERPAAELDLVGIADADFRACTAAVIDLANAKGWAAELRAKGLAE